MVFSVTDCMHFCPSLTINARNDFKTLFYCEICEYLISNIFVRKIKIKKRHCPKKFQNPFKIL